MTVRLKTLQMVNQFNFVGLKVTMLEKKHAKLNTGGRLALFQVQLFNDPFHVRSCKTLYPLTDQQLFGGCKREGYSFPVQLIA